MEEETLHLGTNIKLTKSSLFQTLFSLSLYKVPEIQQSLTLSLSLLPKIKITLKVTQSNNFMKNGQTSPKASKNRILQQPLEQLMIMPKSRLSVEIKGIHIKTFIK